MSKAKQLTETNSFECNRLVKFAAVSSTKQFKSWFTNLCDSKTIKVFCLAHGLCITENTLEAMKQAADKL